MCNIKYQSRPETAKVLRDLRVSVYACVHENCVLGEEGVDFGDGYMSMTHVPLFAHICAHADVCVCVKEREGKIKRVGGES